MEGARNLWLSPAAGVGGATAFTPCDRPEELLLEHVSSLWYLQA